MQYRGMQKVVWTLQRGRCWDTGRGLAEGIAPGHAPKTLSYSEPAAALCNLTHCDSIESIATEQTGG